MIIKEEDSKERKLAKFSLHIFTLYENCIYKIYWLNFSYTFETEYRIPGTAEPDGTCTFKYYSSSRKKGEFNSPRYPSHYPSDINCTYLFYLTPNEHVTIIVDHFKVRSTNVSIYSNYGWVINFCILLSNIYCSIKLIIFRYFS